MATIGMWPFPGADLAAAAASHSEGGSLGYVSEAACQAGLSSSITKGWLRIVDERTLHDVKTFLVAKPAEGPVYGLPRLGDVDFTPEGAKVFRKIIKDMFGANWEAESVYKKEIYCREELYMSTKKAALKVLNDLKDRNDVISVSGPIPIGRWRVYWWECYPKGYRISLEISHLQ